MQKWIIFTVVCILIILGIIIVLNFNIETEYIPETEIGDKELRKTIVDLYFQNKETKELVKESRLIDSKKLLREPCEELINMLIQGPENSSYERIIPEGTKILGIIQEKDIIIINFSNEFVEKSSDDKQKYNSVFSIVKTLAELTEVNGIKIQIEGKEIDGFTEIGLDFRQIFTKKQFE